MGGRWDRGEKGRESNYSLKTLQFPQATIFQESNYCFPIACVVAEEKTLAVPPWLFICAASCNIGNSYNMRLLTYACTTLCKIRENIEFYFHSICQIHQNRSRVCQLQKHYYAQWSKRVTTGQHRILMLLRTPCRNFLKRKQVSHQDFWTFIPTSWSHIHEESIHVHQFQSFPAIINTGLIFLLKDDLSNKRKGF